MVATITNKDLALTFTPAIISLLVTAVIYISYTQNPECPQSEGASQCWDFRPLLIPIFTTITVILILTSVYKYRSFTTEN